MRGGNRFVSAIGDWQVTGRSWPNRGSPTPYLLAEDQTLKLLGTSPVY